MQDHERHRRYLEFRSVRPFLSGTVAAAAAAAAAAANVSQISLFGGFRRRVWPLLCGSDGGTGPDPTKSPSTNPSRPRRASLDERADYDSPEAHRHRLVRCTSAVIMESEIPGSPSRSIRRARRDELRRTATLAAAAAAAAQTGTSSQQDEIQIDIDKAADISEGIAGQQKQEEPAMIGDAAIALDTEENAGGTFRSRLPVRLDMQPSDLVITLPAAKRSFSAPSIVPYIMDQRAKTHAVSMGSAGGWMSPVSPSGDATLEAGPAVEARPDQRSNSRSATQPLSKRLRRVLSGAQWLSSVWSGLTDFEGDAPLLSCSGVSNSGDHGEDDESHRPVMGMTEIDAAFTCNGAVISDSRVPPSATTASSQSPADNLKKSAAGPGTRIYQATTRSLHEGPGLGRLRRTVFKVYMRSALQVVNRI